MVKPHDVLRHARDTVLTMALQQGYAARYVTFSGRGMRSFVGMKVLVIEGKLCRIEVEAPVRAYVDVNMLKAYMLIFMPEGSADCFIIPTSVLALWLSGVNSRSLQGFDVEPYRNAWHQFREI